VQLWWSVEINIITGVTYIYVQSNMYVIIGKDTYTLRTTTLPVARNLFANYVSYRKKLVTLFRIQSKKYDLHYYWMQCNVLSLISINSSVWKRKRK